MKPNNKLKPANEFKNTAPSSEKLQKVLARLGYGSRREMEQWIAQGRITIDGRVATIGDRVLPTTRIQVDGKPIKKNRDVQTRVIMYNKPEGEICTRRDPQGRPTIFANLPTLDRGRWISIGRLDFNTSGLLLLTTDGELANLLMHPKNCFEREYAVRVLGDVTTETLKRLTHGVKLEDGMARFEHIVDSGGRGINHWYHVVVMEGRNRLVRRLWESQQCKVNRLKRVRYGAVILDQRVSKGHYRELTPAEIESLKS